MQVDLNKSVLLFTFDVSVACVMLLKKGLVSIFYRQKKIKDLLRVNSKLGTVCLIKPPQDILYRFI